MSALYATLFIAGILLIIDAEGASPSAFPSQPSIETLRHQVSNQEIEIRTFEERLENFHAILDGLQEQIKTAATVSKDQNKNLSNQVDIKIASLEAAAKGLSADIQQLKNHANETTAFLEVCRKALSEYEQRFKIQNQNMEHLTQAIQTVLEALQMKTDASLAGDIGKTYKVKSGDSLDKIAKKHGTTVKELMRINNMNSDKIVVGKTLKIVD